MKTTTFAIIVTLTMLVSACSTTTREKAHNAAEKVCEARQALDLVCPYVEQDKKQDEPEPEAPPSK